MPKRNVPFYLVLGYRRQQHSLVYGCAIVTSYCVAGRSLDERRQYAARSWVCADEHVASYVIEDPMHVQLRCV